MLCRLCLFNLAEDSGISLFNNNDEWDLTKMIAKFLHLELTQGDPVSTIICNECWMHLDDFQKFCKLVESKQKKLEKEFFEVKCVADVNNAVVVSESADASGAPTADTIAKELAETVIDNNEESLLDIKDVLISQGNEATMGEVQEEEFCYANDFADDMVEQGITSDDDIPLLSLLKRKPRSVKKTKELKKSTAEKSPIKVKAKKKLKAEKTAKSEDDGTATTALDISKEPSKYKEDIRKTDEFIANSMQLKCDMCEKILETFSQLKIHFRKEHDCKGYVICCGKRIIKRVMLIDHIQYHLNPLHFQCETCKKYYKSRHTLEGHVLTMHPKTENLKHQCEVCGKKFARKTSLIMHALKHRTDRNFICKICNKAFVDNYRLKCHIKTIHENTTSYICNYCGQKFKSKASFERHVDEHQGIYEPAVQCETCGEWFKSKYALGKHMETHNPIDVECQQCGRICPTSRALKSHIKYAHNIQSNLPCTFCEKTFKKKENLKEHMAIHTGEKHHMCPHCSREFRSKANMYVHIKRDHVDEWVQAKMAKSKTLFKFAKKM